MLEFLKRAGTGKIERIGGMAREWNHHGKLAGFACAWLLTAPSVACDIARMAEDYADTLEAQMIADYVSEGMTLVDACRTLGVANRTVYGRISASARFAEMMETARANGYEVIANDVRRVARGEEGYSTKDPKRDRLVVETELKLLAKWHPTRYGEKLQIENRTASVAIPVGDDPIAAQKAYEALMKGN